MKRKFKNSAGQVEGAKLCTLGRGPVRGNRRITAWVVVCPVHPEMLEIAFKNKVDAANARGGHMREFHTSGDVIMG